MRAQGEGFRIVIRLVLGGVFLYAGFTKIADPAAFAGDIAAYRVLPYFGNYLAAAILPWLEAIC
ncbi:MAG TPA: MauE/DoxX family redox-associated membrane protein, partial [Geobacteraceae bacterium]|nr:MauE/DoxX family redox-associated membrane protein [Geobacteraceae bacterium]